MDTSEKNFEYSIETSLLAGGPTAGLQQTSIIGESGAVYGEPVLGYQKRLPQHYDRALCLDPDMLFAFIYATQPETWAKLQQQHGADQAKDRFLKRLVKEIEARGTLDVIRNGVVDLGCKFKLAYFRPETTLNEEHRRLYNANILSVMRQVHYSLKNENSLDLVLFLNGLSIITAEFKNPLKGQTVEDAVKQYRRDRDPKEPLFTFGRCLAHFAVDTNEAYMTTHLQGPKTRFRPL